jgi:hypothetical protein
MTQIYKVLKDFELDGEAVRSGQEVVCRAREADKLQKEGFVVPVNRELDPKEPKDAALIAKSDARAGKRHDEIKDTQAAQDIKREERELEKDEVRAKKVEEAVSLMAVLEPEAVVPDVVAKFEAMPDDHLDKEIEAMKAAIPAEEEKPDPAPEKTPAKEVKTPKSR